MGSNASFNITASGTAPLSYQWRFAGTKIGSATGTSYTRINAQFANAGSYDVIVTNSFGSITSAVAGLSVVNRPSLASPQKPVGGAFTFTLVGTPGYNYAIEGSTNLTQWVLLTTLTNINGQTEYTDPGAANLRYRFYRARVVP